MFDGSVATHSRNKKQQIESGFSARVVCDGLPVCEAISSILSITTTPEGLAVSTFHNK
jgi:hypothetical protein